MDSVWGKGYSLVLEGDEQVETAHGRLVHISLFEKYIGLEFEKPDSSTFVSVLALMKQDVPETLQECIEAYGEDVVNNILAIKSRCQP